MARGVVFKLFLSSEQFLNINYPLGSKELVVSPGFWIAIQRRFVKKF